MGQDYTFQFFGDKEDWVLKVLVVVNDRKQLEFQKKKEILNAVYHFLKNKHIFDVPLSMYYCLAKDGVIESTEDGVLYELNNTAYHTFEMFEQFHDNKITKLLNKDVLASFKDSLTYVHMFLLRDVIENNASDNERLEALKKVDFLRVLPNIPDFEISLITKRIARSLAASLGKEYPTTEDLANHFVVIAPFLLKERQSYNYEALKDFFNLYIEACSKCLDNNADAL